MRRRVSSVPFVVTAALVLAACFNDRTLPTSPNVDGIPIAGVDLTINANGCVNGAPLVPLDEEVKFLIDNLFGDATHRSSTLTQWEGIKRDKLDGKPIQNHIDHLTKWTLEHLAASNLSDPDGLTGLLNATTGSVRLLDLVFSCSGEVPTQVPEPPAGVNAAFELVDALAEDQQVNTSFGDAGAFIPGEEGGALENRSLLVLVRQPAEVQVNTPFPKLSHTIDIALAGGKLKAGRRLSVIFCPSSEAIPHEVNHRAVIAHQVSPAGPDAPIGEGVEYLDPPEGGDLNCHEVRTAWQSEKGFLRQRAAQFASLARKAWRVVGPRQAYAGHAAIGGSTPFGSPMVAVDPFVETEIVITDVSPNPATYGETVNTTARLRIRDIPSNPEIYRGTFVNPDVVTGVVNKTQTRNTNLPMAARVDEGARTAAVTDDENSAASWAFPCVDAGPHTVTVDFAETLVIANAPRYGASTASAPFTVNQRTLTVTADNQERVYGDGNPDLTGSLVGTQAQCDDPAKITPMYATAATPASDVGTYPITADVAFNEADGDVRAANYNLVRVPGTLTITRAPLDISADSYTRAVGQPNPEFTGAIGADQIKNNDDITLTFATAATSASPAGTYPIVPTAVGTRLFNYFIQSSTNGSLSVVPVSEGVVTGLLGVSSGDGRTGVRINPGSLFSINPSTGLATIVGSTGILAGDGTPGLSAVALDPTTGILYGMVGSATGCATLITINGATGAGTVVGNLVGSGFNATRTAGSTFCPGGSDALAFASDGTLYAGGWGGGFGSGSLLRVNKGTGAVLQANATTSGIHLAGLAFAPDGTLWASRGGNGPGVVHRINPANGQTLATLQLRTAAGGFDGATVSDLAFASDGTLYASLPRENVLATINTTTLVITRIGSFGSNTTRIAGLTFAPASEP
jgi:hypothetical protein